MPVSSAQRDIQPGPSLLKRAGEDLILGFVSWRIWWTLGIGDIRQRYRRSRLGQFWITLSMVFFVVGIGLLYSQLLRVPTQELVPFIATNIVVWNLISGILSDSTGMYTSSENYLRNEALPKTIFALRVMVRNFLIFAHNVVIIPVTFLLLGHPASWTWLLIPVGLAIIMVAGFLASIITGLLSTRFRDLPQIITNVLQVAFFLTPIVWPRNSLPSQAQAIVDYNPFAIMLHVVSEPIRGIVPSARTYELAFLTIALLAAAALPLFARYRARIVYWL
jgi:lipopolysaccharide transport system permease protein